MPKSNVRFVAIWAALVPVLTGAALLVAPLHIAAWSEAQTGLAVAEGNALSALVLAAVAYLWAHSVREPAALQGGVSAFAIATLALGGGFGWWDLSDQAVQLVVAFVGSVLVLVLVAFNRQVAYAPETVNAAVSDAKASALRGGGGTGVPPATGELGQASWFTLLMVVAIVVLFIAVFWGWRP